MAHSKGAAQSHAEFARELTGLSGYADMSLA
jgi:hypothetical protein